MHVNHNGPVVLKGDVVLTNYEADCTEKGMHEV